MIPDNAPNHHLPPELLAQIEAAHAPVIEALHKRLNTPVEGNKYGGFPGVNFADHRQTVRNIRQELIEKWNAENPDHEYIVPEPLEKPLTPQEIEAKVREARAKPRMAKQIDHAHEAHIAEVLKDHPEEHHEGLREFLKHETDTYGLRPGQHYWRRATTTQEIEKKGLDPHNLMHRYQHHKEVMAEAEQSNGSNSETSNA